jgi:hypothetical protein
VQIREKKEIEKKSVHHIEYYRISKQISLAEKKELPGNLLRVARISNV